MGRGLVLRAVVGLLMITGGLLGTAVPASAVDYTLTGTLAVPDGVSLRGEVHISLLDPTYSTVLAQALVGTDGSFSVTAPDGVYDIGVSGTFRTSDGTDGSFSHGFGTLVVDSSQHRDLLVPLVPVTVDVVDGNGTPIGAQWIDVNCTWTSGAVYSYTSIVNRDNTPGTKTLWARVDPGTDPYSNGCKATVTRTENNFVNRYFVASATQPNHLTVAVPDLVTISGQVTTSDARMAPTTVDVRALGDTISQQTVEVGANGSYSADVQPGEYALLYRFDNPDHAGGAALWEHDVVDATTSQTRNKHISARPVTVHVVEPDGQPATPAPTRSHLSCLRELDLSIGGVKVGEWIDTSAGTTSDPVLWLPGMADNDPAWVCTADFVYNNEDEENPQDSWYGQARVPADSGNEITVVRPGFGVFDGPPTGGADDPDGVPNIVEASAPNSGDGNYDGVPDYEQDNVTSLPGNGGTPGDQQNAYVTIVAPAGTTLTDVSTMPTTDAAGSPPQGASLPQGLNGFTLDGIPAGSDQTIRVYTPVADVNAYAKYDPSTQAWSLLPPDRVTVNQDYLPWVEITLTDGGIGDTDGAANGQIVDPGGVAVIPSGDTTPPVVSGRATTAPNAAGWYRTNVRIDWTATDPSQVQTQPADTFVSTQGADVTATSPRVCDRAPTPNCGTGTLSGLQIDKAAPSLSVNGVSSGASYVLGSGPTPGCVASDSLSGLASACTGVVRGGNAAGVGTFTYNAVASDVAGNVRTVSASWRVAYRFDGFAAPLNGPGLPVSVFKAGSTVPVAFTLKRADGSTATPVARPVWVSPVRGARTRLGVNEAVSTAPGTQGTSFVWRNGRWQFDWSTKGLSRGYVYRIGVRLDDGTTKYLSVGLG